jgi:single-stranded-DNA-specific exonuclease
VRSVNLTEISPISEGKHTRLAFSDGKNVVCGMYFSCSPSSLGLYVGDKVDVLFNIDINEWAGRRSVQMIVRDVKQSASERSLFKLERERFFEVWNGASFSAEENILPTRDDFAFVYRAVVSAVRSGNDTLTVRDILHRLIQSGVKTIGFIKLFIIVKVMQELNIMGINELSEETYQFSIQYKSGKTELDRSTLLRRLRSQQII